MPKMRVTMIEDVLRSVVTLDGCHTVLWLRTVDDGAMPVAVPRAQIPPLIDFCALALSQSERILPAESLREGIKTAVTWWNSSVEPQSGELTLDLTFGSGGTLSFAFSERMANALLATLQLHYGSKPANGRAA